MRDDIQLGRVCRVLCALANRADYWAYESEHDRQIGQLRPTPMAQEVALGKEGCSRGEMILVQVAWAFWNGETVVDEPKRLRFSDMLVTLDGMRTRAVAELMIAERSSGTAHAVDAWLSKYEQLACRRMEVSP